MPGEPPNGTEQKAPGQTARAAWRFGRHVAQELRRRLFTFIGLDVVYRLVAALIIGPPAAWLVARFISTTGTFAVSNFEIASFLLSPVGIGLIAFVIVGGAVALFTNIASIVLVAAGPLWKQQVSTLGAFRGAVVRLPGLVRLALWQTARHALALAPLGAAGGLAFLLLMTDYDLQYYVEVKPPAYWWMLIIGGALAAAGVVLFLAMYARWLFAVPVLVLEERSARAAMKRSAELVRGSIGKTIGAMLAWLVTVIGAGVILVLAIWLLEKSLLRLAGSSVGGALTVVSLLLVFDFLLAVAFAFVTMATYGITVTHLYFDARLRVDGPDVLENETWRETEVPEKLRVPLALGLVGGLVVIAALTVAACVILAPRLELGSTTMITAHRGSSNRAPENTMPAILAAIEDRADYCEIDVQEVADGEIMVYHDKDLKRFFGDSRGVWELPSEEMQQLDLGVPFGPEYAGEHIPTLREVIDATRGKIKLNIELKFHGHEQGLVDRVVQIVEDEDVTGECIFMSLDYDGLMQVKERLPDATVGLTVAKSLGNLARLDVEFIAIRAQNLRLGVLDRLLLADKEVHVWTVNDVDGMLRYLACDVHNIITDEPAMAVEMRDEFKEINVAERLVLAFRYRLGP